MRAATARSAKKRAAWQGRSCGFLVILVVEVEQLFAD